MAVAIPYFADRMARKFLGCHPRDAVISEGWSEAAFYTFKPWHLSEEDYPAFRQELYVAWRRRVSKDMELINERMRDDFRAPGWAAAIARQLFINDIRPYALIRVGGWNSEIPDPAYWEKEAIQLAKALM